MINGLKKDITSSHTISLNELYEILQLDVMVGILVDKMGISTDKVIVANSWDELGFDDLDGIEFIMAIEKIYNCYIDDISANQILEISPKRLCQILLINKRDQNIEQIIQ